jgi:membrane-associated phospholipid phosphatase
MENLRAIDEGALFWCENHHSNVGNMVMESVTRLGNTGVVLGVIALGVIFFWLLGRRRTAVILLLASLLGPAISYGVKYAIKRERPDVAWRLIERPTSPSFPSGHAVNSMAVYGSLALLASRHLRSRRVRAFVLVIGFLMPLVIGLSRPYLGVHYPSDVLAGWTAGLACALLALWADQRWGDRERFAPSWGPPFTPQAVPSPSTESEGIRAAGEVTGFRSPD